MRIGVSLYADLLGQAAASERKRMHYDLRTSPEEGSMRMLNALQPDPKIPLHRHNDTSESVFVLKGIVEEVLFDNQGNELERVRLTVGEGCQVSKAQYHTAIAIVPSVIVEFKDGMYDPDTTEDIWRG